MKIKNERKYYIQSRNLHLMNILEESYFIEVGIIDIAVLNRFLNNEKISLNELVHLELLSDGIGKITADKKEDVYYQLNYLINLRLKNSTCKFLLTAGTIKYIDELQCEKYAPVVLIPFDFDYQHLEIIKNGDAQINNKLIKYTNANFKETVDSEEKRFLENIKNHKITSAKDIDSLCLTLANLMHTSIEPTSYFTIAFVEYPDFILDEDYMSIESSINEMTEEMILHKYFQNSKGVLPTNINQKYVILKASDGERLAINGRLGSGKTYTIINILTDQIAKGKKILYVNQDLDNIFDIEKNFTYLGLSGYTYNLTKNLRKIEKPELVFEDLDEKPISYEIISEIFSLPKALQKRIHGFKVSHILEYLAIIKQKYSNLEPILLENTLEFHEASLIYHQLVEIEACLEQIDLYANNIWHRLQTSHNNIMPEDIIERSKNLYNKHELLYNTLKNFVSKYQLNIPINISDLYKLVLHIYSFASIRPLDKWQDETIRKDVLKDLREIQGLVDINYSVNKYYEAHIAKSYKPGRMKNIFDMIVADHIVIDEDYQSEDALFVNRLLAFDNKLILLSKEIADNILRMNRLTQELAKLFNFTMLDDAIYALFSSLSNFIALTNFNQTIFEAYYTIPGLFTKYGDEIVNSYSLYKQEKAYLPKYVYKMENLTKDNIEAAIKKGKDEKAFKVFINYHLLKKEHIDPNDIILRIKRYYTSMKSIDLRLSEMLNIKDFDENFVNLFVQFYQYTLNLNVVQKTYFKTFLSKMMKEPNHVQYLKKAYTLLKEFKDESYRTSSLCTTLRSYNINIIEGSISDKVEKLKIWNEYLKTVDTLKDEIKEIFNGASSVSYDDIVRLIKADLQYQQLLVALDKQKEKYQDHLGKYYHGLDTTINEIGQTIEHYDEFFKMLKDKRILNSIFKDKEFETLLDEARVLDNLYLDWNLAYRMFAVCFKGSQPKLLTNSFSANYTLFKQYISKTDQIHPILKINSLTEEFLQYGLKNLFDGIRSCKYGKNISKQFIYSVLLQNYQEALIQHPILNHPQEEIEKIKEFEKYEIQYCRKNLEELIIKSNELKKNPTIYNNIEFNNYNKLVKAMLKTTQVFFSDLDIFNGDLDLNFFDLVILDDVHLSTANKYGRLSECKQALAFGDLLFQTSVSNALMKRLGNACSISFYRRYVLANAKFNNSWEYTNQYIYSFENRYSIVMSDTFEDFIKDIFNRYKTHPEHIINIVVTKEETRRKVYTAVVNLLNNSFSPEEIINILCYKIRILNALTEGNRYVNDVFMYYDDFKDVEDSLKDLIFKNFITAHNSVVLYFIKNRIEAINNNTRISIQKAIGKNVNILEPKGGIVPYVKKALVGQGLRVEDNFGGFDLVIKNKKPMGIVIVGKENENLNTFIDDYQYYHDEYEKRGWNVKLIYTLDLFVSFKKVIDEITKEAKTYEN